jgi:hypothetical protein
MMTQLALPFLNLLHWCAAITLFTLTFYCYRHRNFPTGPALGVFFFLTGFWSFFAALIFLSSDFELKVLLNRIKLLSPPFIPLAIFWLGVSIHGKINLPRWAWAVLCIIPGIAALLTLSPFHYELFIGQYSLTPLWGYELLSFKNGPWFIVHDFQARVLVILSIFLILNTTRSLHPYH